VKGEMMRATVFDGAIEAEAEDEFGDLTGAREPSLRLRCECMNVIEWDDLALGYHRPCMRRMEVRIGKALGL
jgi:hypothetical protein